MLARIETARRIAVDFVNNFPTKRRLAHSSQSHVVFTFLLLILHTQFLVFVCLLLWLLYYNMISFWYCVLCVCLCACIGLYFYVNFAVPLPIIFKFYGLPNSEPEKKNAQNEKKVNKPINIIKSVSNQSHSDFINHNNNNAEQWQNK